MISSEEEKINLYIKEIMNFFRSSIRIKWKWGKFTSFFAKANYRKHNYSIIEFSQVLWYIISDELKWEIIAHEICHILDHCKNGHGKNWQRFMYKIGLESNRNYFIKQGECDCSIWGLSIKNYFQLIDGQNLICSGCKTPILIDDMFEGR